MPYGNHNSFPAELPFPPDLAALDDGICRSDRCRRSYALVAGERGPLKAWSGLPGVTEFREKCAVGAVDAVLTVVLKSRIGITQKKTRCGVDPVTVEKLRRQFSVLALHREGLEILISLPVILLHDDPQKTAVIELIGCPEIGQFGSK